MVKYPENYRICDRCGVNIDTKNLREKVLSAKTSEEFNAMIGCIELRVRKRVLHFCSEKCKIIMLRGRKYYRRKLDSIAKNMEKANVESSDNQQQ